MKKRILIILILINGLNLFSQDSEFMVFDNGLIYRNEEIKKLKLIADSLHLDSLSFEINKKYYSKQQAVGHHIVLSKKNIKAAKKDIKNNISYTDFLKKYPDAQIDDNLLVVKIKYTDYNAIDIVEFISIELGSDNRHQIKIENQSELYTKKLNNAWIYNDLTYSESLEAFYFVEEFTSIPLPEKYTKRIQYSDYLIDTTALVSSTNLYSDDDTSNSKDTSTIEMFMQYVYEQTKKPEHKDNNDFEKFIHEMQIWDSLKYELISDKLANTEKFKELLNKAVEEGLTKGGSTNEFEHIVGLYLSKEIELSLKRNRFIIGDCSLDNSPRSHALEIATLAAETGNLKVFLRSHLDLMNDNFNRMSDGSYAWDERHTYIKELEELKINTPNLILGILYRIENPIDNHYYGNIARLGRAIAESKYTYEIENEILNAITDKELDAYNRIIMYYLFLNYNHNLKDEKRKENNEIRIKNAVNELPEYLSIRIESENYQFERLLKDEIDLIHQHFIISEPMVGGIGSIDWDIFNDGESWNAKFKDKNESKNLKFNVTMEYTNKPGSIKPLIEQKDSLLQKVNKVTFLMNHLNEKKDREIEIHFTINKSFSNEAQKLFKLEIADSLENKYSKMLDNTIFLCLTNEKGWSRWLIFPNGDIMLWHFDGGSPLEKYTAEELISSKGFFNNSFMIFDNNGNIKNK